MHKLATSLMAATAALLLCVSGVSAAYPERPITVVIGYGAGGTTDIMGRAMCHLLALELGTNIVVKNVAGAAGTIGAAEVAQAKPDGYTLMVAPVGTMASQPNLRKLPYNWDEFTTIARISANPVVVCTTKNSPWNSFNEAVDDIRKNPDKYFYASTGAGGSSHVQQAALFFTLGLNIGHMPAKDSGSAALAMQSGTVQLYADPPVIVKQFDLKPLALFAEKRMETLPDVPTFKELGVDIPVFTNWYCFYGPPNLPEDIRKKLEAAAEKVLTSAEFKVLCDKVDMFPGFLNSKDATAFATNEYNLFSKYMEQFGLKKK